MEIRHRCTTRSIDRDFYLEGERLSMRVFVATRFRPNLALNELRSISFLRMLDWAQCEVVEHADDKVSGAWVFKGTRVPVRSLFENLESGATVDQFLEWFPGVTCGQVAKVLEYAEQSLIQV
jgi:uncharacterized protein (DUF433 family)